MLNQAKFGDDSDDIGIDTFALSSRDRMVDNIVNLIFDDPEKVQLTTKNKVDDAILQAVTSLVSAQEKIFLSSMS